MSNYTLGIMGQRLDSSDSFKELNAAYKKSQEGRSIFKFDYSNIANAIADKVGMPKNLKVRKTLIVGILQQQSNWL